MSHYQIKLPRRSFLSAAGVGVAALAGTQIGRAQQAAREEADASQAQEVQNPVRTPNTPFAVNVEMWFGRRPFLEKIRQAADMGFPAIEFWPFENKPLEEARKLLQERSVAVSQFTAWGFGRELNHPESDHQRFVKKIEESCEVADLLDCKLFTVVIGDNIEGYSKEEMHAAAVRGLKMAAPICEKRNKTIIIEAMNPRNHPGHCLYGSRDAIAICQAVGSPNVKINWDLYHMQIVEGDLCMRMREGFDYIGYLQLADNPGRHEPGTGEVNYTRVLQEIKSLGYDGYVGLECTPRDSDLLAARRVYQADLF
jgi:hydroxypyruvate isomerase